MNLMELAGHLGSDAEERFTANGKRVISFRMATKVHQGGKDETIWWRVNIWHDRFDKMLPYLKKGAAVIVVGELSKPETYVDKEGKTQVSLTVTAEILKFSPFGKSEKSSEGTSPSYTKPSSFSPPSGDPFAKEEVGAGAGFAYGGSSSNDEYAGDDLPF